MIVGSLTKRYRVVQGDLMGYQVNLRDSAVSTYGAQICNDQRRSTHGSRFGDRAVSGLGRIDARRGRRKLGKAGTEGERHEWIMTILRRSI